MGIIILILNVISPGLGSLVASYLDPKGCNCKCATNGILQALTAVFIAGYIWSIMQGLAIYKKSKSASGSTTEKPKSA
jgi:hypothetical protein